MNAEAIEIDDAKQDLREALTAIHDRVGERIANLRPDFGIRRHPVAAACVGAGLGVALGSRAYQSSGLALFLLGAAVAIIFKDGLEQSR
jgi:hypothetical protein